MSEVPSGLPDAEAALLSSDAIDRALATLPADLRIAVILRDVGVAADVPTDETRHRALRRHLAVCVACRKIRDEQRAVRVVLAARPNRDAPPDFAARVMANLDPAGSWLDALDWRRWTFRLAPVATALFLVAAVGLRTTVPADTSARSNSPIW